MKLPDLPPLVTMSEAKRYLNVSYKTIQRWKDNREISVVRLGKNIVRIPRSEIERVLRDGYVVRVI
jgi:excisionase family DNA binding protein